MIHNVQVICGDNGSIYGAMLRSWPLSRTRLPICPVLLCTLHRSAISFATELSNCTLLSEWLVQCYYASFALCNLTMCKLHNGYWHPHIAHYDLCKLYKRGHPPSLCPPDCTSWTHTDTPRPTTPCFAPFFAVANSFPLSPHRPVLALPGAFLGIKKRPGPECSEPGQERRYLYHHSLSNW